MREYVKKPESQSRTLDSNPKASRQAPIDVILQRYKERNIQRYEDDEELIQGKFETVQCEEIEEDELFQRKLELIPASKQEAIQREEKPNNMGLPDDMKIGIENLSGYSMDDVRVRYNSPKPAQLQAHAYTRGTDIHVAPGQERHLPHEAWHVVQQKQGRVQPTMQMQGVNVNDNEALEHEADVMGGKAIQLKSENTSILQLYKWKKARLSEDNTRYYECTDDNRFHITWIGGVRTHVTYTHSDGAKSYYYPFTHSYTYVSDKSYVTYWLKKAWTAFTEQFNVKS